MRILIINASHREGNTDIIVEKVRERMRNYPKAKIRELKLRDIEMKLPDGCEKCGEGEMCPNVFDEFSQKIEPTIRDYDVYILATPTWSDGVTPLAKIFWDRIVFWCHKDRKYLRGERLAVITHGMAGNASWKFVVDWVKSVCTWEEAKYSGSLTFKSSARIGNVKVDDKAIEEFVKNIIE